MKTNAPKQRPGRALVVIVALGLTGSWGCSTTHVVTADADGRPQFQELTVIYEIVDPAVSKLTATTITLSDAKAHPLRTAFVSRTSRNVESDARSELRLVVHAPHPDGDVGMAQASLQVPDGEEDRWRTKARRDLPRGDVELLLTHLANGGLFDSQTRPNCNARVAVQIDGHRFEKPWTRIPRLDRLAVETYDAVN